MSGKDMTRALIEALEELSVPYMLVGALSSNRYGVLRTTNDADTVVEFGPDDLRRLRERLGPDFVFDPQITFETLTGTTRYEIHPISGDFALELFALSDDPFDRERFSRRQRKISDWLQRDAVFPTPEDVVIMKLRWARPKDREDAKDVMAVQGDRLDWNYINGWCERHGTRALLDEIRRSIPPDDAI